MMDGTSLANAIRCPESIYIYYVPRHKYVDKISFVLVFFYKRQTALRNDITCIINENKCYCSCQNTIRKTMYTICKTRELSIEIFR